MGNLVLSKMAFGKMALGKMALSKMAGRVKQFRVKWNWVNCHVTSVVITEVICWNFKNCFRCQGMQALKQKEVRMFSP